MVRYIYMYIVCNIVRPEIFGQEKVYSCVKDFVADMAIFIALAKILSLENYYNTKIAGLGENFIPQKF